MFRQSSNNQQFGGESAANKIKLDIPEQSGNVDDTDSFSETDIMGVGKYLNEIREKDIKSNNGSIFESSKPIFERFIKELDKITDSSKKEKISEIIKKLEETDVTFNKVLKKIIDTYDINDIIGTKTFIDFQFKMYEAEVNALRVLLDKLLGESINVKGSIEELMKISTKKLDLINEMILGSQDTREAKEGEITNPIVLANKQAIIKGIADDSEFSKNVQDGIIKFQNAINQQGGLDKKQQEEYVLLRSELDTLFSFYKTSILVSIVFLLGYPKEIETLDDSLKEIVKEIIGYFFIEIDEIFPTDIKEYSTLDKDLEKECKKFDETLESIILKHTNIYKNYFPNSKRVIFIPKLLGLLRLIDSRTYAQVFEKDKNDIITVYKKIGVAFFKMKPLYEQLVDETSSVKEIDELYNKILDKTKVVYTYISERTDYNKKNPRFNFEFVNSEFYPKPSEENKKASSNLLLTVKEYDSMLQEGDQLPSDVKTIQFPIGSFDGFFKGKTTKEISEKVYEDIKAPFLNGEIITLFGIGQSGSGKTSLLIFFDKAPNPNDQDGVLIEVLKKNEIKEKFEKLTLQVTNIYTSFPTNPFEGKDNRYVVTDLELNDKTKSKEISFKFNEKVNTWVLEESADKEVIEDKDKIGQIIVDVFENKREIEPTTNNPQSSRSHVVLCIKAIPKQSTDKVAKILVCDLAGAEGKFQCKGIPNDIKKFFDIYTGKAKEDGKWDKYMRKIYFDNYKCLNNDQKTSDKTLDEITTNIEKYIKSYNDLLRNLKDETKEKSYKIDLQRGVIGEYCGKNSPLPYDGESIKEHLEIMGEKIDQEKYKNNLYNKEFKIEFSDIHKFDFFNREWRDDLDKLKDSFGKSEEFTDFFEKFNNDSSVPDPFYQQLLDYIKAFGIYVNSTGFGSQPNSIAVAMKQIDKSLENVNLDSLDKFQEDWRVVFESIKKKFSEELDIKNFNSNDERSKVLAVLSNFRDFMTIVTIGFTSELANPSPFRIKGGLNRINSTTEFLTIKFNVEEEYIQTIFKKNSFKEEDTWKNSKTFKLFNITFDIAKKFLIKGNSEVIGKSTFSRIEVKTGDQGSNIESLFEVQRKKIYTHLTLARLYYSCYLRVQEGYFINQALYENQQQITDLIIEANIGNLGDNLIYWDTKYNPSAQNFNLASDTVFSVPKISGKSGNSIIIEQIKKLAMENQVGGSSTSEENIKSGQVLPSSESRSKEIYSDKSKELAKTPTMRFMVFTVVNTSSNVNNPPNPPYYNLNLLKQFYYNNNKEQASEQIKKLLLKAKNDDFYKNNDKVKNLQVENVSPESLERDFKNMIDIFDKNNLTTLVGTVESTEKFGKLNFKYLSFKTNEVMKILNAYSEELKMLTFNSTGNLEPEQSNEGLAAQSKYIINYNKENVDV